MREAYYDTNYLFKLQCQESGSIEVLAHAQSIDVLYCSLHGKAEFISAAHRKIREGSATQADFQVLLTQLHTDTSAGGLRWLPINDKVIQRVEYVYRAAPANTYLRAADAIHLASAAEMGFNEIYSNDKHLLAAATLFGLKGLNVIP